MQVRYWLQKFVMILILTSFLLIVLNGILISALSPKTDNIAINSSQKSIQQYIVKLDNPKQKITVKNLFEINPEIFKITFLGKSKEKNNIYGYVDFLSPQNKIYVSKKGWRAQNLPITKITFLNHEYGHILQKQLLAKESGGYPNILHPITSLRYYINTYRLEKVLKVQKFETRPSKFTEGIESNADCISQIFSKVEVYKDNYLQYVGHQGCNTTGLKQAQKIINGEWPDTGKKLDSVTIKNYSKNYQKNLEYMSVKEPKKSDRIIAKEVLKYLHDKAVKR